MKTKTSLVYHLSWMLSDCGIPVVAADFDPQANLTSMFLEEDRLETLWDQDENRQTVYGAIEPILRGTGDIAEPHIEKINENLHVIPGDLGLSRFEDRLSDAWPRCHNRDEASFRTMTAFYRIIEKGASWGARLALIDVGPNLGAINRAALIASDLVYLPLAPDLFSLQGLKNLGPTLREWRKLWEELKSKAPHNLAIPKGSMNPSGYIVMQHGMRESRPVKAYQKWLKRIPDVYRKEVLDENTANVSSPEKDPYALALLKHYRSLMPMAMEARKPMFFLKPADGAIGAHMEAVNSCYNDFKLLAEKITGHCGIALTK
jgi:chromosome partitioning protein